MPDLATTSESSKLEPPENQVHEAQPLSKEKVIEVTSSRRLFMSTVIYGAGMVLSRAASFIMLPIYTRLLTPTDYGLLQMLDMTLEVLGLLVSAGWTYGIVRFYFKAETEEERRAVISSGFLLNVGLNLVGSVVMAIAAVPIWRYGLSGNGSPQLVLIAAANFTVGALTVVPLILLQMQQRALAHSSAGLAKLILQLSLNILFLVVLDMGPKGILLSTLISNSIIGGALAIWVIKSNGMRIRRRIVRDLRRFGLPYQVAMAGTFILTFGDRVFLEPMKGLAVVGIYSFAYQFGFLLDQIGRAPYARAWYPARYAIVNAPKEFRDAEYNKGVLNYSLILLTTAVGIALFVHPVLSLFAGSAYRSAADLVPIILVAYVMQAWGEVFQFGIDVSEQTKYSTYAVWASVAVIIPLYAVLIPYFSAFGAAIATALSFMVRLVCQFIFAQRLWHVNYRLRPHLRLLLIAAVVAIAAPYLRQPSPWVESAVMCGLLAIYAVVTWLWVLDTNERQGLMEALGLLREWLGNRIRRYVHR
ncbi:MAG TPA: oligosaccharide flippase family protein [Gemmatimonadaceae bacterium]